VRGLLLLGQPAVTEVGRNGRPGSDVVQAAAGIFAEHGDFIRGVIHFHVGGTPEEEDLFQGFFLSLIGRSLPPDVQNLKGYLYQVITNYVRDSLRRRAKYRSAVKKYASEGQIPINIVSGGNVLIEDTEENDTIFASLIRHLQERQAQAFLLRYRHNCTVAEIAARMGVKGRTVSRYLSQSLKALRKALAS
jgi:RNA polymerase sigma factor (sigma-70 family)